MQASSSSRAAKAPVIGAAVGAGLGVLLLTVGLVVYFRGRDSRKRKVAENRVTVAFENPTVSTSSHVDRRVLNLIMAVVFGVRWSG